MRPFYFILLIFCTALVQGESQHQFSRHAGLLAFATTPFQEQNDKPKDSASNNVVFGLFRQLAANILMGASRLFVGEETPLSRPVSIHSKRTRVQTKPRIKTSKRMSQKEIEYNKQVELHKRRLCNQNSRIAPSPSSNGMVQTMRDDEDDDDDDDAGTDYLAYGDYGDYVEYVGEDSEDRRGKRVSDFLTKDGVHDLDKLQAYLTAVEEEIKEEQKKQDAERKQKEDEQTRIENEKKLKIEEEKKIKEENENKNRMLFDNKWAAKHRWDYDVIGDQFTKQSKVDPDNRKAFLHDVEYRDGQELALIGAKSRSAWNRIKTSGKALVGGFGKNKQSLKDRWSRALTKRGAGFIYDTRTFNDELKKIKDVYSIDPCVYYDGDDGRRKRIDGFINIRPK